MKFDILSGLPIEDEKFFLKDERLVEYLAISVGLITLSWLSLEKAKILIKAINQNGRSFLFRVNLVIGAPITDSSIQEMKAYCSLFNTCPSIRSLIIQFQDPAIKSLTPSQNDTIIKDIGAGLTDNRHLRDLGIYGLRLNADTGLMPLLELLPKLLYLQSLVLHSNGIEDEQAEQIIDRFYTKRNFGKLVFSKQSITDGILDLVLKFPDPMDIAITDCKLSDKAKQQLNFKDYRKKFSRFYKKTLIFGNDYRIIKVMPDDLRNIALKLFLDTYEDKMIVQQLNFTQIPTNSYALSQLLKPGETRIFEDRYQTEAKKSYKKTIFCNWGMHLGDEPLLEALRSLLVYPSLFNYWQGNPLLLPNDSKSAYRSDMADNVQEVLDSAIPEDAFQYQIVDQIKFRNIAAPSLKSAQEFQDVYYWQFQEQGQVLTLIDHQYKSDPNFCSYPSMRDQDLALILPSIPKNQTTLDFYNCSLLSASAIIKAVAQFPDILTLGLWRTVFFNAQQIKMLADLCPKLDDLRIDINTTAALPALLEFSNLEHLSLNLTNNKELTNLDFLSGELGDCLASLNLDGCVNLTNFDGLQHCLKVSEIYFRKIQINNFAALINCLVTLKNLNFLAFHECELKENVSDEKLVELANLVRSSLPNLRLSFSIRDEDLQREIGQRSNFSEKFKNNVLRRLSKPNNLKSSPPKKTSDLKSEIPQKEESKSIVSKESQPIENTETKSVRGMNSLAPQRRHLKQKFWDSSGQWLNEGHHDRDIVATHFEMTDEGRIRLSRPSIDRMHLEIVTDKVEIIAADQIDKSLLKKYESESKQEYYGGQLKLTVSTIGWTRLTSYGVWPMPVACSHSLIWGISKVTGELFVRLPGTSASRTQVLQIKYVAVLSKKGPKRLSFPEAKLPDPLRFVLKTLIEPDEIKDQQLLTCREQLVKQFPHFFTFINEINNDIERIHQDPDLVVFKYLTIRKYCAGADKNGFVEKVLDSKKTELVRQFINLLPPSLISPLNKGDVLLLLDTLLQRRGACFEIAQTAKLLCDYYEYSCDVAFSKGIHTFLEFFYKIAREEFTEKDDLGGGGSNFTIEYEPLSEVAPDQEVERDIKPVNSTSQGPTRVDIKPVNSTGQGPTQVDIKPVNSTGQEPTRMDIKPSITTAIISAASESSDTVIPIPIKQISDAFDTITFVLMASGIVFSNILSQIFYSSQINQKNWYYLARSMIAAAHREEQTSSAISVERKEIAEPAIVEQKAPSANEITKNLISEINSRFKPVLPVGYASQNLIEYCRALLSCSRPLLMTGGDAEQLLASLVAYSATGDNPALSRQRLFKIDHPQQLKENLSALRVADDKAENVAGRLKLLLTSKGLSISVIKGEYFLDQLTEIQAVGDHDRTLKDISLSPEAKMIFVVPAGLVLDDIFLFRFTPVMYRPDLCKEAKPISIIHKLSTESKELSQFPMTHLYNDTYSAESAIIGGPQLEEDQLSFAKGALTRGIEAKQSIILTGIPRSFSSSLFQIALTNQVFINGQLQDKPAEVVIYQASSPAIPEQKWASVDQFLASRTRFCLNRYYYQSLVLRTRVIDPVSGRSHSVPPLLLSPELPEIIVLTDELSNEQQSRLSEVRQERALTLPPIQIIDGRKILMDSQAINGPLVANRVIISSDPERSLQSLPELKEVKSDAILTLTPDDGLDLLMKIRRRGESYLLDYEEGWLLSRLRKGLTTILIGWMQPLLYFAIQPWFMKAEPTINNRRESLPGKLIWIMPEGAYQLPKILSQQTHALSPTVKSSPSIIPKPLTYRQNLEQIIHFIQSGKRFMELMGPPGAGKTTSITKAIEIMRKNGSRIQHFMTMADYVNWRLANPDDEATTIVQLDDCRLWPEGQLEFLRNIQRRQEFYWPEQSGMVRAPDVIFLTNNPESPVPKVLTELNIPILKFNAFTPLELKTEIVLPLLTEIKGLTAAQRDQAADWILDAYQYVGKKLPYACISVRELTTVCQRLEVLLRVMPSREIQLNIIQSCYEEFFGLFTQEKSRQEFWRYLLSLGKLSEEKEGPPFQINPLKEKLDRPEQKLTEQSAMMVLMIQRALQMREKHLHGDCPGKCGLLFQGPPGILKTKLILEVLIAEGFKPAPDEETESKQKGQKYFYNITSSDPQVIETQLKKAYSRGWVVLWNESNFMTKSTANLLLKLLEAPKTGFCVFFTQNDRRLGSQQLSRRLRNRLQFIHLHDYSLEDLIGFAKHRGLVKEAELIANMFVALREFQKAKKLPVVSSRCYFELLKNLTKDTEPTVILQELMATCCNPLLSPNPSDANNQYQAKDFILSKLQTRLSLSENMFKAGLFSSTRSSLQPQSSFTPCFSSA